MGFGLVNKSCTLASTGYALSSGGTSSVVAAVLIQAKGSNSGKVYVGPSTVDASGTTGICLGVPVSGTTPPSVRIDSGDAKNLFALSEIYVASEIAGDGVVAYYYSV